MVGASRRCKLQIGSWICQYWNANKSSGWKPACHQSKNFTGFNLNIPYNTVLISLPYTVYKLYPNKDSYKDFFSKFTSEAWYGHHKQLWRHFYRTYPLLYHKFGNMVIFRSENLYSLCSPGKQHYHKIICCYFRQKRSKSAIKVR